MRLTLKAQIRAAVNGVPSNDGAPKARPLSTPLGASVGQSSFVRTAPAKVDKVSLVAGLSRLSDVVPPKDAFLFPPVFATAVSGLLRSIGIENSGAVNGALNALLLREDKPVTAAFVKTVMENPSLVAALCANLSRYAATPSAVVLPQELRDPTQALERIAFLGFWGNRDLTTGLVASMEEDLYLKGDSQVAAARNDVLDVVVVGQGPTGSVLAGQLGQTPDDVNLQAMVIGRPGTFREGEGWYLNSVTRDSKDLEPGEPGGALNVFNPIVTDGDLSSDYYSRADVIHTMSVATLHSADLPVAPYGISEIRSRDEGRGYSLTLSTGAQVTTSMVALGVGLGELAKPLKSESSTNFIREDQSRLSRVLNNIQFGLAGETIAERLTDDLPKWLTTLDFFKVQRLLNSPLGMFAPETAVVDLPAIDDVAGVLSAGRTVERNGDQWLYVGAGLFVDRERPGLGFFSLEDRPRDNLPTVQERAAIEKFLRTGLSRGFEGSENQVSSLAQRLGVFPRQPFSDVIERFGASGPAQQYVARATYRVKNTGPVDEVTSRVDSLVVKPAAASSQSRPSSALAQKVVAVVGLGDSSRTALENITGFGPLDRAPKQLGITPKLIWYVGENGPKDCAEFYVGNLTRGLSKFSQALGKKNIKLYDLMQNLVGDVTQLKPTVAIEKYLAAFENLLSVQKPKAFFFSLIRDAGYDLSDGELERIYSVFLSERDAVRPRYNQLAIPIEKGQIELRTSRVADVRPTSRTYGLALRDKLALTEEGGQTTLVDFVLDGRGTVNSLPEVLGESLAPGGKDPFQDPALYELIEAVDSDGQRKNIGKRLKGTDIYLFGPAAGVADNSTAVGANVVSIFLNAPLNALAGEALVNEVVLRVKSGQLGTPDERNAKTQAFESRMAVQRAQDLIILNTLSTDSSSVIISQREAALRNPLEPSYGPHLVDLRTILQDVRVTDKQGQVVVTISQPDAKGTVSITAPYPLLAPLKGWAQTPAASAFLSGLTSPLSMVRGVDPETGRLTNPATYI